jgi:hypothetical protein
MPPLSYLTEQVPWKADSHSASKVITHGELNLKDTVFKRLATGHRPEPDKQSSHQHSLPVCRL